MKISVNLINFKRKHKNKKNQAIFHTTKVCAMLDLENVIDLVKSDFYLNEANKKKDRTSKQIKY